MFSQIWNAGTHALERKKMSSSKGTQSQNRETRAQGTQSHYRNARPPLLNCLRLRPGAQNFRKLGKMKSYDINLTEGAPQDNENNGRGI